MKPAITMYRAHQAAQTHPEVSISEFIGVRNLHLSSDAIQGSMRLAMPDQIELEYVQQMMMWLLFKKDPRHIGQLGRGAAALTKCCYRQFPHAKVPSAFQIT